ncbi:tol-pal system-associated acyl-CoA thioesterase [Luteibacter anthropi]|uniref:Tol-pal system-associated acyl-CoA thioesterase n=1 Tax=Luteibacter anthropi TaxID=564369 RepID=A0A7X5ZI10_9GAMM|nr:tol-pal system-associated acyl-CoA thioesterase [Luteibacter anthropi]NII06408.1 tol-pal system-associated acyl-CoA thioesterase [Luteibacter anthropi]URX60622.1 tol-pal system-associated acyl-CoA thioesterase [Luteibacter anthropi]
MSEFTWPIRIYWEDTDAGGLVYHANYVRYFERARTEWLRSHGIDQSAIRESTGLAFVLKHMHLDFHAPARLDDELLVSVAVKEARSASILFSQSVARGETLLVQAEVRVAMVNLDTMRPAKIPAELFPAFFS